MKPHQLFETARDSDHRLQQLSPKLRQADSHAAAACRIILRPEITHQKCLGFGGALTESSGYVLSSLAPKDRDRVLAAFFSPEHGHGYRFARTHINSCDFSLENWACMEEKDETLESFSMQRTDAYQTGLIQAAQAHTGNNLQLMLSPWSPPGWMKSNKEMNNGGVLLKEYYPLWARYIVKFITELDKRSIPVWAMSIQNEPAAVQTWDSCVWTAHEEAEFAISHLAPALSAAGYDKINIFVWDHNRDLLWQRFRDSMSIPGAQNAIAGAAFHWYSGDQYEQLSKVAGHYPDKLLVFTEGCIEGGPRPGAWFSGERYAHNIINDLNHGCHAWIDWNIALDMQGGPNHVGNYCDAPVLVDTVQRTAQFQSSYYYIGHFSRFIQPGAVRMASELIGGMIPANVDGRMGNTIESTAFRNPDGSTALVLCNRTEDEITYSIEASGSSDIQHFSCPPRAIQTLMLYE